MQIRWLDIATLVELHEDRGGRKRQASCLATPSDVASLPRTVKRPALVLDLHLSAGGLGQLILWRTPWSRISSFTFFECLVGLPATLGLRALGAFEDAPWTIFLTPGLIRFNSARVGFTIYSLRILPRI